MMQMGGTTLETDIYHRLYGQHRGSDGFGSRVEWHFRPLRAVNMSCQSFFLRLYLKMFARIQQPSASVSADAAAQL